MCYLWLVAAHADEQIVELRWQKSPVCLCVGNSPVTDEFPAQRASNAEMFPFDDVIMY